MEDINADKLAQEQLSEAAKGQATAGKNKAWQDMTAAEQIANIQPIPDDIIKEWEENRLKK